MTEQQHNYALECMDVSKNLLYFYWTLQCVNQLNNLVHPSLPCWHLISWTCCITCLFIWLFLSLICLLSYLKLVPPELHRALFNDLQDFWGGQVTSLAMLLNPSREERENLQTTRPSIVIPVHKFDVTIHWRNC